MRDVLALLAEALHAQGGSALGRLLLKDARALLSLPFCLLCGKVGGELLDCVDVSCSGIVGLVLLVLHLCVW